MIEKIYSNKIIQYANNIPLQKRLKNPEITILKRSIFCGSYIEIDIITKNQKIIQFGQTIKACILGSAASAIVANNIINTTFKEIKQVHLQMSNMLKNNGNPPTGKFTELILLISIKNFKNKHISTMLILDALISAITKI